MKGKRYLVLHLNSNGDILYGTVIARQLKEVDDPGCHITWAVAKPFKNVLLQNPYIDEILEVEAKDYLDIKNRAFREIQKDVEARKQRGEWDEIICSQLMYENMWRYDGTIRRAVLRAYRGTITVPVEPVLELTQQEVANVKEFARANELARFKNVVLFECSPLSKQSSVNPSFAIVVAERLIKIFPDSAFILSSNTEIRSSNKNIIDGSKLSLRENAELTHYCTHFVGCSSGITWIATSNWAKRLPMLQLSSTGINPVSRDFKREGIDDSNLVEMGRFTVESAAECLKLMLENEFDTAKQKFNQKIPPAVEFIEGIFLYLCNHGHYRKAFIFIARNLYRHSFPSSLLIHLLKLPFLLPSKFKELNERKHT